MMRPAFDRKIKEFTLKTGFLKLRLLESLDYVFIDKRGTKLIWYVKGSIDVVIVSSIKLVRSYKTRLVCTSIDGVTHSEVRT